MIHNLHLVSEVHLTLEPVAFRPEYPLMPAMPRAPAGLDSSTALALMQTIKGLALKGHTVMCSIHQPRTLIFDLFDHLLLLAVRTLYPFCTEPVRSISLFVGTLTNSVDCYSLLSHVRSLIFLDYDA